MIKVAFIVPDNRDELGQFDGPSPFFGTAPQALLEGFAQLPDCEIHVVSTARKPVRCPEKIASNIYFHSLRVPRLGRLATLNAGTIFVIRSFLKQLKPDVVHGQGSERYPAIAATFSGFPNAVTLHGLMTHIVKVEKFPAVSFLGVTAMLERQALRRTDAVLCLSHHAGEVAREFNSEITVIPNSVPDRFFEIERKPGDAIEIICPAHLYHLKNQHGLIEALDPLAQIIPLKLTLLGKSTGDHGSKMVETLAMSRPWCRLAGLADSAAMADALSRATLLVLPSFEENCPMSLLEGMAAGVPIAASRAGGIPDLIEDGVTGLLFDPRDPASIRGAIERMVMNPDFAQGLAAAGRKRAETEFRTKRIAERHLEFYANLAQRT